jgi:hypothetical protein
MEMCSVFSKGGKITMTARQTRPSLRIIGILNNCKAKFRKLDLFPPSGDGREMYSVGSLTKN